MHASISLLAAVAATVAAETVVIQAGLKGFTFWPPEATANQGDIIQFQFPYGNHTVVQSEYNTPCQWYQYGFDSGPINYKTQFFEFQLEDTTPIWYFCSLPGHCQGGMVGVINPPPVISNDSQSIDDYGAAAAKTNSSTSYGKLTGGQVVVASFSSTCTSACGGILTSTPSSSALPSSLATISGSPHSTTTTGSGSSSPTSSTSSTHSAAATGGGSSLMKSANPFLLSAVLGLGVVAVMA